MDPATCEAPKQGNTIIGTTTASPTTARTVTELLTRSGLRASVVYDIRPHLWGKLVANAAVNALSALLDCDAGEIPRDPNAARLAEALAEETASVAAALKINLPFVNPWQYVTEVVALGADAKSSMAYDLESGHPSEIDHINGAVVAFGRRTGTPTPYNDAMVRLVKAREALLAHARTALGLRGEADVLRRLKFDVDSGAEPPLTLPSIVSADPRRAAVQAKIA